jgi:6-phosphofructokinase 2
LADELLSPSPPIVTLTLNPCIDVSTSVDHIVADRKLRCGQPRYEPGGGGINVARAIGRLGGEALAIYPAGGAAGDLLRSLLDREPLAQRPLSIAAWTRENVNVLEEATGRQFRLVFPGPSLESRDWEACLAAIESLAPLPEWIVASGSLPPGVPIDFYARLARWAKESNVRLAVDASGAALEAALNEGVFLAKPSLREFQELAGLTDADEGRLLIEARKQVLAGACEILVLSLGVAGVLWVAREGAERVTPPTVPAKSTVGAGDSLLAGVVLALHRGLPLPDAVRFGVAAAAATVMKPGTELCEREDAERLFEQMASVAV